MPACPEHSRGVHEPNFPNVPDIRIGAEENQRLLPSDLNRLRIFHNYIRLVYQNSLRSYRAGLVIRHYENLERFACLAGRRIFLTEKQNFNIFFPSIINRKSFRIIDKKIE